tara:strand:+ start:312 stop:551 length:240 start_codon:yes stop_codon:yes gene_type:complete
MMPSITLNANSPTLFSHPKNESPTLFRVQISVGQNKEALILLEFEVVLEIFKELPCMELLDLSVSSYPRVNDALLFKLF